jgi:UDP-N-acetylmuramoyl-L-alanyl-D-glutamate--2,6-diaminopimelate ligase
VAFDVGVFMNVTHEHLEFHGSWEQYRHDKANLFRALDRFPHEKGPPGKKRSIPSFGVACADDPSSGFFRSATFKQVVSFSGKGAAGAGFRALSVSSDAKGSSFDFEEGSRRHEARIELPGAFNVDNTLAALATVSGITDIPVAELLPLLPRLRPVLGRMTAIDRGQPFEVIVDYAHTPSSFQTIFPPLRLRAKARIITVFGSAGERDTAKRPLQGAIAARYSDVVIITDEDPRGEDPMALCEEIAAGCGPKTRGLDLFLIPDRPGAIERAFSIAAPADIVLLLGKGHENSIIYADGPHNYDEIETACRALARLGYGDSP